MTNAGRCRAAALLALAAATAACAEQEPEYACTLIGCGEVAHVAVRVDDAAALDGATLELCSQDRCAMLAVPPATNTSYVRDELFVRSEVWSVSTGQTDVMVFIEQAEGLADGDVYTLALRARDGSLLDGRTWTATYVEDYPNGRACDPRCMYAQLAPAM